MSKPFHFKQFSILNTREAFPVGTDAVLLGASLSLVHPAVSPEARTLLDIGCGTGIISLMVAQRLDGQEFHITAIDSDAASARQAAENFDASRWTKKLTAVCASLQEFSGSFDHIFSNPPYFDASLCNQDPRLSSARHTESLSFREICAFAAESLKPGGRLSLVLPSDCEKELLRTAASYGLYPFRMLYVSGTRVKKATRLIAEFSSDKGSVKEEREYLQNGTTRSEWYRLLTEDFYTK